MRLDLSSLEKAIESLSAVFAEMQDQKFMAGLNSVQRNGFKAGVIQNFEFTYELCWKFMQRWLSLNLGKEYVAGVSRQELFRFAAEHRLIQDINLWMDYHRVRNLTAHTYDEEVAEEILQTVEPFLNSAKHLLVALRKHND